MRSFDQLERFRAGLIQTQKSTFPEIQHNSAILAVRAANTF